MSPHGTRLTAGPAPLARTVNAWLFSEGVAHHTEPAGATKAELDKYLTVVDAAGFQQRSIAMAPLTVRRVSREVALTSADMVAFPPSMPEDGVEARAVMFSDSDGR